MISVEKREQIRGAYFVDEASGQVYRVASRRMTTEAGDHAILTLDREIVAEDVNLVNDFRCQSCGLSTPDLAEPQERIRTVWVFPPPVEPGEREEDDPIVFSGKHPVVDITVRTVAIAPTR